MPIHRFVQDDAIRHRNPPSSRHDTIPQHAPGPVCHIDMYPTVLDIVGVTMKHQPVIDGISIVPLFEGKMESRPKPLGFAAGRYASKDDPTSCEIQDSAWIDGRHMLCVDPPSKRRKTESAALYDIMDDPAQEKDIAAGHPEEVQRMLKDLAPWHESVKASFAGKDYLR